MGRVRQRDTRGRGRRCDHDRRHATQQHPSDRRRRGIGGQAAGGGRPGLCRRRILGWCGAGQCSGPAWAARRGSVRLQVLPAALGRGRVSTARSGGTRTGPERNRVVRRDDDRARRRRARNRPCGLAQGRQLHRLPVVAASRRREPRDRRGHRTGEVDGLPGAYPASIQLRRTSDDRVRAPGRRQTHGGDVPALSVVRVGRDSGGRDSVQVLSTDPRGRPTGNCCGRAWPTVSSTVS